MTQRALARLAGVKASHIAYIEGGRRRPSLSLVRRLAGALQLNRRELLFLAHPEARYLLGRTDEPDSTNSKGDAWQRFASKRRWLRQYSVTPAELRVLKQVAQLERVSRPKYFLFILNSIRQAVTPGD